jgi:hypothetical protein
MRSLDFSDGFTSSTAPTIMSVNTQEDYVINNGASAVTLLTLDNAQYSSVFISFDLTRVGSEGTFRQQGSMLIAHDGTQWVQSFGNFHMNDIITDETPTVEKVKLYITNAGSVGSLKYDSGTMGATYSGKISMNVSRISK